MKYLTIVIEYEDGDKDPAFGFNTELLGGKVSGFMAGSLFDEQEKVSNKAKQAIDIIENLSPYRFAEQAISILEELTN